MSCAVAVTIGDKNEQAILHVSQIHRIVSSEVSGIEVQSNNKIPCLRFQDGAFPIINLEPNSGDWPYFLILTSNEALGVKDYSLVFGLKYLPDGRLTGEDINGRNYTGKPFKSFIPGNTISDFDSSVWDVRDYCISGSELTSLEEILEKIRQGEFYAVLTEELSEKIKRIADEMIAFREDLQKEIEPNIAGLVIKEIPETSNELEGINETLEKAPLDNGCK